MENKMPTTFFILLHWKRQQRVFLQNMAKLTTQRDTKVVHDFRVAIKKLRSYLKLLILLLNKTGDENGFKKTEQLFNVLGKYRDIEIGLLLLESFEKENKTIYTAFRFHLKVALQRTEIWVQNALAKYDEKALPGLTQELEKELKETNRQKLLDKAGNVLNKELKKLKRLAGHLQSQPHEVRKMLKNIFYWLSICPKDFFPIDKDGIRKLKKSLDHLGDWQDHEMLCRKIKHFRKDFVPESREEYLLLKELEKDIESKMNVKLHKADESIQAFIGG